MQERIKKGSRIKDQDKYYKQQEILISEKTFAICKRLPEFCMDYVLAREVAVNSRYAYAQDLEIFFRFITESIKEFEGVKPNEITESDMKKINIKMLQAYSNHMKLCDLSANTRSRRLTSVRGLFKWLWKTDVLDVDCSMKLEMPTSDQREEGHVIHYLTEDQIKARVRELGAELMRDYEDKNPVFVGVLKGVVVFYADMIRAFDAPCQLDFMWVSSYQGTQSTGNMVVRKDVTTDLTGRHVVILEDILDTGRSLRFVVDHLKSKGAASVKICTLLDKPEGRVPGYEIQAEYTGFSIPNAFVVGYGLDYDEKYRNLPYVGILKPEVYE